MLNENLFKKKYPKNIVLVYDKHMELADLEVFGKKKYLKDIRPVTESFVRTVKEMYSGVESLNLSLHGKIPSNLLYFAYNTSTIKIAWYNKPEKRKIFAEGKQIFLTTPTIIYLFDEELKIFCCEDEIPTLNSDLYKLLLPNTYSNGTICWGNVKLPEHDNSFIEFTKAWEKRYWNSDFTHSHINETKRIKKNIYSINTKEDSFNKSLNQLL